MNEIGKSPHVSSRDQALAIAYSIKRRGRAEGGAADDDYLIPPPDASLGLSGNPYFGLPGKVAAGVAGGVLSLPRRAFEASEGERLGVGYNPGPILEAATLPMTGGLAAPVGMRAGEAALGAGPIIKGPAGVSISEDVPFIGRGANANVIGGPNKPQAVLRDSLAQGKADYEAGLPQDTHTWNPIDAARFNYLVNKHLEDEGFTLGAGPTDKRGAAVAATTQGIRAYHGSPYDFGKFDFSKIGTGEGAQAYGHGGYFAGAEPTAEYYRQSVLGGTNAERIAANVGDVDALKTKLSRNWGSPLSEQERGDYQDAIRLLESGWKPPKGHMYEVNINADPSHFLDWDAPLSEQPHIVEKTGTLSADPGSDFYQGLGSKEAATKQLQNLGIPGIKYLDQGSRMPKSDFTVWAPRVGRNDQFEVRGPGGELRAKFDTREEANAFSDQENAKANPQTHNYVVFDDSLISILRKYGLIPGAAPIVGAAAKSSQSGDTGMADGGALSTAYRVKRDGYAFGGPPVPWQVRAEARGMMHTGPIPSIVPGRTDNHNMSVPSGAYVVPAQAVSHLGQNNTNAGMAVLSRMFGHSGPYGVGSNPAIRPGRTMPRPPGLPKISDTGGARGMADDVGKPVPIAAAGGEFVIHPEDVAKVGGGDVTKGHQVLDKWVNKIKEDHIRTLRKLPGPAKS